MDSTSELQMGQTLEGAHLLQNRFSFVASPFLHTPPPEDSDLVGNIETPDCFPQFRTGLERGSRIVFVDRFLQLGCQMVSRFHCINPIRTIVPSLRILLTHNKQALECIQMME